jgi:hypothetical protein
MSTTRDQLSPGHATSSTGSSTVASTAQTDLSTIRTRPTTFLGPGNWQTPPVLVTTHVLSGAVLGALAPDVPTALTRGFASHFVLDAIPHWGCEPGDLLKVAVPDGLIGLAAIAAVARIAEPSHRIAVLAGVFGACLPDLDKPGELFFGRSPFPRWFDWFHGVIQHEQPQRWKREVTVAAGLAVLAGAVLHAQRRGSR